MGPSSPSANRLPFPVLSDPDLALARALSLQTFEVECETLYKRATLIAERAPSSMSSTRFPPDRNAEQVVRWLERER